jgi:hypothetical protein
LRIRQFDPPGFEALATVVARIELAIIACSSIAASTG